ncbi:MAG: prepilin peptidase, partial [Sphingomonadales bacterium]|nr:prepilin peptidase [Sphingomonadales bacterium]
TSPWANILTFAGVLVFFTILFATGQMGGGDVKLIATISLWAGPYFVFDFILITALVGGVVAAVQLVRGGQTNKSPEVVTEVAADAPVNHEIKQETQQKAVPYGLAIGFGGIYLVQQLLNQLN